MFIYIEFAAKIEMFFAIAIVPLVKREKDIIFKSIPTKN